MIYCVWYPSGGFGHFVNAILSLHGNNFARPSKALTFSDTGDSHNLDLVVPKYLHNRWPGNFDFSKSTNYSVLIDNGINDESTKFKSVFPESTVIKICYTNASWPIIARTLIEKAMSSNIETALTTDAWGGNKDWMRREKYFLYLRDHELRTAWRNSDVGGYSIFIDQMYQYQTMFDAVNTIASTESFENIWTQWRNANDVYISPVEIAQTIINYVKNKTSFDLGHIKDVWTQSVVYYFIQLEFGIEVPHNDYSNWFTNVADINKMLSNHGVST